MSFDFSAKIDPTLSRPIYLQLLDIFETHISEGKLVSGELIPSENELCEAFHISRTTVRQTLRGLEDRGMIERRRGLGTFISVPKVSRTIDNMYSFTEQMEKIGKVPSSRIMSFKLVDKNDCIAPVKEFESQRVVHVVRVRLADDCPMLVEETFLPVDMCPNLSWEMIETTPLYSILSDAYGLAIARAVETYEAVIMTKEEAQVLQCDTIGPAFLIKRSTWDNRGKLIEYTKSIAPSSRSKFEIKMYQDGVQVERKAL